MPIIDESSLYELLSKDGSLGLADPHIYSIFR